MSEYELNERRPVLSREALGIVEMIGEAQVLEVLQDYGEMPKWVLEIVRFSVNRFHDGRLSLVELVESLESDEWLGVWVIPGMSGEQVVRAVRRFVWACVVEALNDRTEYAELEVSVDVTATLWGCTVASDADGAYLPIDNMDTDRDLARDVFESVLEEARQAFWGRG